MLYAVDIDGKEKWKYDIGATIISSPTLGKDGTVYVGAADSVFYAIAPEGDRIKWSYKTGGSFDFSSAAIAEDGTIYVGSTDGALYAFGD